MQPSPGNPRSRPTVPDPSPTPYSQELPQDPSPRVRFLKFGIPYLALNVPVYVATIVMGVVVWLRWARDPFPHHFPIAFIPAPIVLLALLAVFLLPYSVAAGVLALKGKVAGVWMGLVHVSVFTVLAVLSGVMLGGTAFMFMFAVVAVLVVLLALGAQELDRHSPTQRS